VPDKASVQLDQCTAAGNKGSNLEARGGAEVKLVGCTVASSSKKGGWLVNGKDTLGKEKDSTFRGDCLCGVYVAEEASARLGEKPSTSRAALSPSAWRRAA
jgi:hypothetical protein